MEKQRKKMADRAKPTLSPAPNNEVSKRAETYDFRRPDRIAKDQLRSIHGLHETFTRTLASSLSAYLRAYVQVSLVSVEQLSFSEFTQCLPSPTCIIPLSMKPYEGSAALEINPSLAFPILEMLLGGTAKVTNKISREVTEIEQNILEGLFRIILQDLRSAWAAVAAIDFSVESFETEPQLLQILAPNEAVVAISIEARLGDHAGMMNLAIPSIVLKMLRQKFDQQWSVRKTEVTEQEYTRMLRLLKPAQIQLDARLQGTTLTMDNLLDLQIGDVLMFDFPVGRPLDLLVNGRVKYRGEVITTGRKRALAVTEVFHPLG
jgi:flagellar motor switch protein FliM